VESLQVVVSLAQLQVSLLIVGKLEKKVKSTHETTSLFLNVFRDRDRLLAEASPFRRNMIIFVSSGYFSNFMLFIILANTIVLAAQTSHTLEKSFGYYFSIIDLIFLAIYTVETTFKIYAYRKMYFKSGWNNFGMIDTLQYTLYCRFRNCHH
jgi:hypothetical protein